MYSPGYDVFGGGSPSQSLSFVTTIRKQFVRRIFMFDACLMTVRLTLKRDHFNGTATTALHHVDDGKSGLTITWDRV